MKKGILVFAHNNREIDYALMSIISAGLAKKYLEVPASLVTDKSTVDWMKDSKSYDKALEVFEQIIITERPVSQNTRLLYDGNFTSKVVPFNNSNRSKAYELTPYDRTLLLDSDFLVFSNRLSAYWDVPESVMISSSINDIVGDRLGYADIWVSETGIPLYWATNVMFTKNQESKIFFDLVEYIRINYHYYSDLYRFNPNQYRNDISFSIAKHTMNGFEAKQSENLPPVLTSYDKDLIYSVDNNSIKILINSSTDQSLITSVNGLDIHVMNKNSIVRHARKFLELI